MSLHKILNLKKIYIILLSITILSLLVLPCLMKDVSGASYNISQSRRYADIDEFPESYRSGLRYIQKCYPNAQFIYFDTDLDWDNDLLTSQNQLKVGRNLIPSSAASKWKSKDPAVYDSNTGKYKQIEPGWCQASREGIQYYIDPRNFFNEDDIFMFLNLSFDESQTIEGVQAILDGTFMDGKIIKDTSGKSLTYAEALFKIGKLTDVSPYLLASRIRQEQGRGASSMISGYSGYYNYFNIGAYGSTTSKILNNGLGYAKTQGWDTPYKSILGGAKVLAESYVESGKNTLYLQHFNVAANDEGIVTYSVYMANILAPINETSMMLDSLTDKETPYSFVIPVYKNMPGAADTDDITLGPRTICSLDSLIIDDGNVNFGTFYSHKYKYSATIKDKKDFVIIKTSLTDPETKLSINDKDIEVAENEKVIEKVIPLEAGYNKIKFTVTAKNGMAEDYIITLVNDDGETHYNANEIKITSVKETNEKIIELNKKTTVKQFKSDINIINGNILIIDRQNKIKEDNSSCVSSDKLVIMSKDSVVLETIPIVIYGDVNYDGLIDENDINIIKEHILEISTLKENQKKYADVDKDGKITVKDLGLVTKASGKTYSLDYDAAGELKAEIERDSSGKINFKVLVKDTPNTIEGFIVYDEGQFNATNATNSGRIHFVSNGSTIKFENGLNHIEFSENYHGKSVSFSIETIDSYNFSTKKSESPVTKEAKLNKLEDKFENECYHKFEYHDGTPATLERSKTDVGFCLKCGKVNTKIVHGTRLQHIDKINISVSDATLGVNGLPTVTTYGKEIKSATLMWQDDNNALGLQEAKNINVKSNNNYRLNKIVFTPAAGFGVDEYTRLYVNNQLFSGLASIVDGNALFYNVGQCNFTKPSER